MNIYNNSTIGTNTYPQNATFTNIETTNLEVLSSFSIQGASKGGILVCEDNTNDIGQVNIGVQNMVLASDALNSGLPIWTDSVTLNTATLNGLNLNGVQAGDLIVGSGVNSVGRLPIGALDRVLFSNGTTAGWQSLTALNQTLYSPLSSGNVTDVTTTLYTNSSLNVIAGRRYRITLNAQINLVALCQLSFAIPLIFSRNGTYEASGDVNIMFIWTAVSTGSLTLRLNGQTTPANNASVTELYITVEEY